MALCETGECIGVRSIVAQHEPRTYCSVQLAENAGYSVHFYEYYWILREYLRKAKSPPDVGLGKPEPARGTRHPQLSQTQQSKVLPRAVRTGSGTYYVDDEFRALSGGEAGSTAERLVPFDGTDSVFIARQLNGPIWCPRAVWPGRLLGWQAYGILDASAYA
jgi:hypothetical protein